MDLKNQVNGMNAVDTKTAPTISGGFMLLVVILGFILTIYLPIQGGFLIAGGSIAFGSFLIVLACLLLIICCILPAGFHIINPNEAIVMTLFGKYYGTLSKEGFYYANPFAGVVRPFRSSGLQVTSGTTGLQVTAGTGAQPNLAALFGKKISTKTLTLNNEKQKVNDQLGNPVIIGSVVIWRVTDPTKAVFNVDNFKEFLSIQCDSTIRNIARLYPYDTMEEDSDEKTLRGSSREIAESMKQELQQRVEDAGLEIQEVRITHLSYSEEIAAAMLQRQQAVAIIAARQKIVEGAVGMVKMAIDQLGDENIVLLDEERKAAMVSNLLVVLCGNRDAQPIVNTGTIY